MLELGLLHKQTKLKQTFNEPNTSQAWATWFIYHPHSPNSKVWNELQLESDAWLLHRKSISQIELEYDPNSSPW